jgi:hypothetical protein
LKYHIEGAIIAIEKNPEQKTAQGDENFKAPITVPIEVTAI